MGLNEIDTTLLKAMLENDDKRQAVIDLLDSNPDAIEDIINGEDEAVEFTVQGRLSAREIDLVGRIAGIDEMMEEVLEQACARTVERDRAWHS